MIALQRTSPGRPNAGRSMGSGSRPGNVHYMTLRAIGLVRSVDVLAFFAKRGREGNARKIFRPC